MPNAGHGLESDIARAIGGIIAFFLYSDGRIAFPTLGWDARAEDADVLASLTSDIEPVAVRAWTATSSTGDFRRSIWEATEMAFDGDMFSLRTTAPGARRLAVFGEAEYALDGGGSFLLSTRIRIFGGSGGPE